MAKAIVVGAKLDPKPNMGAYAVQALMGLGHVVPCVLRSREVWIPGKDGWGRVQTVQKAIETEDEIAHVLDKYIDGVEALFLCTPANPPVEMAYIQYAIKRGIFVSMLPKGALGNCWQVVKPHLHMIGRYGTVGGRTLILPWLKLQQLRGKRFVMYAYLNASVSFAMHQMASGSSPQDAFRMAKDFSLAEPGATDYVSFFNAEIGMDMRLKLCIAFNEAIAAEDGPFVTPAAFDKYVDLSGDDIRERALPTERNAYLLCIDNISGKLPLKIERGKPGTLYAEFDGYRIVGGFCDVSRDTHIANWMQGGPANGVQIVFEGNGHETGRVEIAGPGAGPDTVWSAIINMNEYLARRSAIETRPRVDGKHSVAENAAAHGLLGPFEPKRAVAS